MKKYLHLSVNELHELLLKGEVTPELLVKEALLAAKNDDNNAYEYISEKEALEALKALENKDKNNLLWGIPYVLKDNCSTKDIPTTASSNILANYVPIFSSEVYLRLKKAGAILIGKTTLDELAMGGTGTTGKKGRTYNPWDKSKTHQVGGSSAGSAAALANGDVAFAIGSDTGDSVRKPASYSALVGFKPTWGRISRFGLFPFAPSMDHVAYFTRNVTDSAILLNVLAGRDEKDSTSSFKPVENYLDINGELKGKRFAVIKEIFDSIRNKYIKEQFNALVDKIKKAGGIVEEVSLDINLCKAIYPTYMVISCAEATSNNANLDGIKFGVRQPGNSYEEIAKNTRTKGFGELIRRRFVIGSYALLRENQEELFLRSQKCRRAIVDATNVILAKYDTIILPASPTTAPLFEGSSDKLSDEYLIADNYLAIGNFGGFPSITLPLGFENGLPFGVNLTSGVFKDKDLLSLALGIEKETGLKDLVAKGE